jgi:signal transduction histidine kinase
MQVIITDNGKGFDQARPGSGGNGLLNMKKRAEDLGGSFEIQSEVGKGTRVEFRIPVGG